MRKAEPQKEDEWLRKLVGEWTFEGEMTMAPCVAEVDKGAAFVIL
jgi:hypothetical protein